MKFILKMTELNIFTLSFFFANLLVTFSSIPYQSKCLTFLFYYIWYDTSIEFEVRCFVFLAYQALSILRNLSTSIVLKVRAVDGGDFVNFLMKTLFSWQDGNSNWHCNNFHSCIHIFSVTNTKCWYVGYRVASQCYLLYQP